MRVSPGTVWPVVHEERRRLVADLLANGDVVIPLCGAGLKHPGE